MSLIHIVLGYSRSASWTVAYYLSEEECDKHVVRAREFLQENLLEIIKGNGPTINPFDMSHLSLDPYTRWKKISVRIKERAPSLIDVVG